MSFKLSFGRLISAVIGLGLATSFTFSMLGTLKDRQEIFDYSKRLVAGIVEYVRPLRPESSERHNLVSGDGNKAVGGETVAPTEPRSFDALHIDRYKVSLRLTPASINRQAALSVVAVDDQSFLHGWLCAGDTILGLNNVLLSDRPALATPDGFASEIVRNGFTSLNLIPVEKSRNGSITTFTVKDYHTAREYPRRVCSHVP